MNIVFLGFALCQRGVTNSWGGPMIYLNAEWISLRDNDARRDEHGRPNRTDFAKVGPPLERVSY